MDDDIVVIEELGNKRPLSEIAPLNGITVKRIRVDNTPKNSADQAKSSIIPLKFFKDFSSFLNPDTEGMYIRHLNTMIANANKDSLTKRLDTLRLSLDKHIQQATSLINYHKQVSNNPLFRPVNGYHPLNTHSSNVQHAISANQSASSGHKDPSVDGLQVVCTVAGKAERLPPSGAVKYIPPQVGTRVYAMKTDLYGIWSKGVVVAVKDSTPEKMYRVKLESNHKPVLKTCTAKQMAYEHPCEVRLPFGKRIIALYKPEDKNVRPVMYAGIIAEPPKSTNRYRYLVFFDDGYAQYIEHEGVRLVYEESKNVWEDIHPDNREFIKSYCEQFPERPMLKLQKSQVIKTEFNAGWWFAKVVDVDASMVRMYFEHDRRFEWIYRGSTRLAPLFNELERAKHNRLTGKVRRHNTNLRRLGENQPYVEYTRNFDEIVLDDSDGSEVDSKVQKPKSRNTARKSTAQVKKIYKGERGEDLSEVRNIEGELYNISLPPKIPTKYFRHQCGIKCREKININTLLGENPLRIPLLMGWERHFKKYRYRGYVSAIHYRAPCGRLCRDLKDVDHYLNIVSSALAVDYFSFDPQLNPLQSFRVNDDEKLWSTDDITEGKERIPIECVNCLTNERPQYVEYATQRFPGKGVNLNLDKEFLCGCSCTDNCRDPLKCECKQLTMKAATRKGAPLAQVGYENRRLPDSVVTGIYECNSRCKCGPTCGNRVVQNGLQIRLQMFKTAKKGWGIRCLDDLDSGTFLCIYAGQLLTDQGADEDGNRFGDEYLAELDHIEVAESHKDGYESDVSVDVDLEDGSKSQKSSEKDIESDLESEASSIKSNSSSSQNSLDSDPEYELGGEIENSFVANSYSTRSKNRSRTKKISLFAKSEDKMELESSSAAVLETSIKLDFLKDELPDLPNESDSTNLEPRPLSPKTIENLAKIQISRKPKIESTDKDKSVLTKKGGKLAGNVKRSQALSGPLPPPKPIKADSKKSFNIRGYFNEDFCYIMDAKSKGNIGRYLNHSCYPNSFVQTVFVDCHDLRFPTVAFFASERIKAGTELTWDYNYDVGSVEGKVLYCHCGTANCHGRLL